MKPKQEKRRCKLDGTTFWGFQMTTLCLACLMPYSSSLMAAAVAAMFLDPDSGGDVEAGSITSNLLIPTKGAIARKLEKRGVKAAREGQIPKVKVLQLRNSLILTVCIRTMV